MLMMPGRFITIEGGEGSGKSTLIKGLVDALKERDIPCLATREPGGTVGGEEIRNLLVCGSGARWDAMSEALLLFAARRDLLMKVIAPQRARGRWILSDRFIDSTVAYQGYGGGLSVTWIQDIYVAIAGGVFPDLTVLLDIEPEIGLSRAKERFKVLEESQEQHQAENRFEVMDLAFHQRVRQGFLTLADQEPGRYVVINGALPPQDILQMAIDSIQEHFLPS